MTLFCGYDIELPPPYSGIIGELPLWEKYYLPVDIAGKVVLDVGAGVGETAAFYLSHGAKKVVCIQPDSDPSFDHPFQALRRNAEVLKSVECIDSFFKAEHLEIPHDVLKSDCEGGETVMYDYQGELKPCVIEAHGDSIADTLCARFSLKRVYLMFRGGGGGLWFLHPQASPLPEISAGESTWPWPV